MKIHIVDKYDSGIVSDFARAIGANVQGRFVHIPESKGAGYITGFSWGDELRMMIRNYYLKEDFDLQAGCFFRNKYAIKYYLRKCDHPHLTALPIPAFWTDRPSGSGKRFGCREELCI
jgi:hypothetical protein